MNGCLTWNRNHCWLLAGLLYTCWVWTLTQVRFLHLRTTYTHCSRWYMWAHWRLVSRLSCSCSKSWNQDRQFRGGSTRPCMPSWWTQHSNTPANRPVSCRYQTLVRPVSCRYQTLVRPVSRRYQTLVRPVSCRYQTLVAYCDCATVYKVNFG